MNFEYPMSKVTSLLNIGYSVLDINLCLKPND
jgi:hypothetical protein